MHPSREARDDEGQTPRDERGTPSINHRMHMLLRTYVLSGLHKRRVRVPLLPSSKGHSSVPSPPPCRTTSIAAFFDIVEKNNNTVRVLYSACKKKHQGHRVHVQGAASRAPRASTSARKSNHRDERGGGGSAAHDNAGAGRQ